MPVIKNIILDWSGTLVDDLPQVLATFNEIFQRWGKPPMSREEYLAKFFLPWKDFYRKYLPEAPIDEVQRHFENSKRFVQEEMHLFKESRPFMDYCKSRGMNLFLLSAIHSDYYQTQSKKLGIGSYFKQAYVDVLDKRKTILHLIADHDLDPTETLFIGDMAHDIESARHAGVVSCAVLTGYNSLGQLKEANPDLLFRNLHFVQLYLERHQEETPYQPIPTVGALIFNQKNEVLMIQTHKWSHKWGIPGGKIKPNETAEAALRREILEETGLEISDIRFEQVYDCILPPEFYKKAHFLLMNYTCRTLGAEVTLNEEAEKYQWCSVENALKLDLNMPTRVLMEHVCRSKR